MGRPNHDTIDPNDTVNTTFSTAFASRSEAQDITSNFVNPSLVDLGKVDTATGLRYPSDGELQLVARNESTLETVTPVSEDITVDHLYTLGAMGQRVPVYNSGVVTSNLAPVVTATEDFTAASESVTTDLTITVADTEGLPQNVSLQASAGTIEVTGANGGTISDNETDFVTIADALPGVITYSYTAPVGPDTVTLTFGATDGLQIADEVTTTVTVEGV